jgi:hypothetical protein
VLLNKNLAQEVASISLQRPFQMATIHIKASRRRGNLLSEFVLSRSATAKAGRYSNLKLANSDAFSVSATIGGDLVRAVADDLRHIFIEEEEHWDHEQEDWNKREEEQADDDRNRGEE